MIQGRGERERGLLCCCQIDVDSLAADSVLEELEKEAEYFLSGELVVLNADVKIMMLH